jgi:Putative glutamine amidotransferase
MFDLLPLTHDPLWPWSLPTVGWPALFITAALFLGGAAWTYLRAPAARPGRIATVLAIRLVALVLVFLALSGTSCVSREDLKVPSLLLVGVDATQSMGTVEDEVGNRSRWKYLLDTLEECKPVLERLHKEHNIRVVFYRFGDSVSEFDPANPGQADGKRTDTAQMLRYLYDKYRGERYVRGLLILSDGADNVASDPPARNLAAQYRNLPCPVYGVTFGKKTTTGQQNDIRVTSLTPEPSVVAAKGKLIVNTTIDSLGRIGDQVRVRVFLQKMVRPVKGQPAKEAVKETEVKGEDITLSLSRNNQVQISVDAPADPGNYRLRVKVGHPQTGEALPGELSKTNNEMSTFLTVTREGVSVLLVEREGRFPEPQMMRQALAADRRIGVDVAWLRGPTRLNPGQKGLFQFDENPYDVIILGDVTAAQLQDADPEALAKIKDRVLNKRTGLLMMGGRFAFGNSDWFGTPLEEMLPVKLKDDKGIPVRGPVDAFITMNPTAEGLKYVLRLAGSPDESKALWEKVQAKENAKLNGMTLLGPPVSNAKVLAESLNSNRPMLVARDYGTGRTMAFACDTTYLWVRPKTGGKEAHSRFWRQVVLWLAHQEDTDDNMRVQPDARRLRIGDNLNFGVELRGKQREELKDVRYQVKVIDPLGVETPVEVSPGTPGSVNAGESRGRFRPTIPGEYIVEASGSGKDASGKSVDGRAEAWVITYQDDTETTEKAANPDFLRDLASAGGGTDFRPGELKHFLMQLPQKPLPNPPPKPSRLPDWRVKKGRSPFLVAFFLLFVQLLTLEWFLRRRWGMV